MSFTRVLLNIKNQQRICITKKYIFEYFSIIDRILSEVFGNRRALGCFLNIIDSVKRLIYAEHAFSIIIYKLLFLHKRTFNTTKVFMAID
jgi:hypothetical protein